MFIINLLLLIIPILLAIAFFTLIKQNRRSYIQFRKGPSIVGPHGWLQPIVNSIKLFTKEPLQPLTSSVSIFIIAPILALTLALTMSYPYRIH